MKKIISVLDISIFGLGLLIISILQLFINYNFSSYFIELLLLVILAAFCCFAYYISFMKNDIVPSKRQALFAVVLIIVYIIIYSLPIYSFFQRKGVNNSVFLCVVLVLTSRTLLYTAKIISESMKEKNKAIKPDYAKEIIWQTIYKGLHFLGISYMIVCFVILVVNSIWFTTDVSVVPAELGLYDLWSKVF